MGICGLVCIDFETNSSDPNLRLYVVQFGFR